MAHKYFQHRSTGEIVKVELFPPMEKAFQQDKFHMVYSYAAEEKKWLGACYIGVNSSYSDFQKRHEELTEKEFEEVWK